MKSFVLWIAVLVLMVPVLQPVSAHAEENAAKAKSSSPQEKPAAFRPHEQMTKGSVTIGGHLINYDAYAGTLVIHAKERRDATGTEEKADKAQRPEASMFYVAYIKSGEKSENRPLTFLYNGGPGSSSLWLHMGAFGPKRVVTSDHTHTPPAPYALVNNAESLLDVSDLVFVDAPGTGFSRIRGKGAKKAFYGVDQDGRAFADFIVQFLSKYGRWNSPKYLCGESYATTRSAVLANLLETRHDVDLNGVILLSQILNFDLSADSPQYNPGIDLPYEVTLPTYAATAWYHHKLSNPPAELAPWLKEVEHFAMTDYARALAEGSALPAAQRDAIAAKLHQYTGLPVAYIQKANLRINVGEF